MNDNNIFVDKGKTKTIYLTFVDGDSNPIDLTDSTIYLTVKKRYHETDAEALLQKIVTVHSDPTNGITQIEILPTDTDGQKIGTYFYDIQYTKDPTNKFIVIRGNFYIRDVITRS